MSSYFKGKNMETPALLKKGKVILFNGDSLTDGSDYPDYVVNTLNAVFPDRGFEVQNSALCGDTTRGLLKRFDADVLPKKPDVAFISIGTNDCIQKLNIDEYRGNLEALVDRLRAIGAAVALIRPSHLGDPERERRFQAYLEAIDQVGRQKNALVIDAHGLFLKWEKEGKEMLGSDGVHHGAYGFEGMARAVLDGLGMADTPMVKEVRPWPGALTGWEVSAPAILQNPDDWKNLTLAKGWRAFDKKGLLASLPWWDSTFVARGAVMTLAPAKAGKTDFGFARTVFHSDKARSAVLEVGGSPPLCVWHNGKPVFETTTARGWHPNACRVSVELVKGSNEFVINNNYLAFLNIR